MTTPAEQYFFKEIESAKPANDVIIGSGYFITEPSVGNSFVNAATKQGYFLALTNTTLYVVKTRGPVTNKPLLENKGLEVIPVSDINKIEMKSGPLLIEYPGGSLRLQMDTKNKAFPDQGKLLQSLSEKFQLGETIDTIETNQKKRNKRGLLIFFVFVVFAILYVGIFKFNQPSVKEMLESGSCKLVTQIVQDQLGGTATCESVSIKNETSKDIYDAIATMDNGNKLKITIKRNGDSIYVTISPQ